MKKKMTKNIEWDFENTDLNGIGIACEGASPGRCFFAQQRGPSCHPVIARVQWNKEVNNVLMECFYRSKRFDAEGKPIRWYRKRVFRKWKERGMVESTEQHVCHQTREK